MARTAVAQTKIATVKVAKSRGGRPTRSAALERDLRLLDVATQLFLERGFDATSIDAVAEAARVSKPTVYGQYQDKRGLFEAVLKREIGRWIAPLATAAEVQTSGKGNTSIEKQLIEKQLIDLGKQMIGFTASDGARAVARILAAQATNFPELAENAYREGWSRAVQSVAALLDRMTDRGLARIDTTVAAEAYLNLVVGPTSRQAIHGIPLDIAAEEKRMRASLKLLLNGILSH